MAQVPYNPVPSQTLSGAPTQQMHPAAPEDAFGAAIGSALSGLGRVSEHAGDELFARAVAMQNLQNETEAKELDTRYLIGSAKLHADYNSKEGQNAVDGYEDYTKDLQTLREDIGNQASNPAVGKLYNNSTLGVMGRHIFNGAGHAAQENKKWATGVSEARMQALRDSALQSPLDDASFKVGVENTRREVLGQAALHGWDDEQTQQEMQKQESNLWSMRIAGLVRTNPLEAKRMFDDAVKNGGIRGEQIGKVNDMVQRGIWTQGSRNVSTIIRSGSDGYWGSKSVDVKQARDAIGEFETGNNYSAKGVEVFAKDGTSRGRALGRYQVMPENLQPWLKQAGLPPMSEDEFLKSPSAQDKVFDTVFGGYMQQYGSFNEAASRWFTGVGVDEARAKGRQDANKTTVDDYLKQTNAILARGVPLSSKVARAKELSDQFAPGDAMFEDYTVNQVEATHNRDRRIILDAVYQNRQTVEGGLMGGFGDGKIPTSVDELKALDPKVEAAWGQLDNATQRRYLGVLAKNAKGDTSWTTENLRTYQGLKGMAASDPAQFLDTDIIGQALPMSARRELINLQGKLKANAEGDPRVTRALNILAPQLNAAGISKTSSKDEYYQFVGSLQDALADFSGETKKTPSISEVQEIGSKLLQTKAGSGWFGSNVGATPFFRVPAPDADYKKIESDPKWQELGIKPTPEQIQRIYTRKVYQDFYGKSVAKPQAKAEMPQVPVSR